MGILAEQMVNGEVCAECGVYLEPNEVVYTQHDNKKVKMPDDDSGVGIPVICDVCID